MPSHSEDFCAKIAFEDPAECLETLSLQNSSFAPTIFTGQKLRGALLISHDERRTFESAQLILRGRYLSYVGMPQTHLINRRNKECDRAIKGGFLDYETSCE